MNDHPVNMYFCSGVAVTASFAKAQLIVVLNLLPRVFFRMQKTTFPPLF